VSSVEGLGFLWNMVGMMVGTLVQVWLGPSEPEVIAGMLAARERQAAGPKAPPHGLYLQWIKLKDPSEWPQSGAVERVEE
jgi:tRNA pseudouridine38-40 synthase